MDMYTIQPDPCDNRLIRFNNCLQLLACICHILAYCNDSFRELACIIDCIADVVFLMTAGCMMGQLHRELKVRKPQIAEKAAGGPTCPEGLIHVEHPLAAPEALTIIDRTALDDVPLDDDDLRSVEV